MRIGAKTRIVASRFPRSYRYNMSSQRWRPLSDANWGKNSDSGKSVSSYTPLISCFVLLSSAAVSFEALLQGPTAQTTTEAELVVAQAAPTTTEAVFCADTMKELGFRHAFRPRNRCISTSPRLCKSPPETGPQLASQEHGESQVFHYI